MEFNAFAKINLGLQVLNKRDDGYHNINTIFYKIGLFDEIRIELDEEIVVKCEPDLGIPQKDNLVYKAAMSLKNEFEIDQGVRIFLKKRIPSGAGLGGGSSDAATTLLALKKLWNIECTDSDLFEIGARLGSDVPFFIGTGAAEASGRGEILDYFELSLPYAILVVFPNVHISTPNAYKALNRVESEIEKVDFIAPLLKDVKDSRKLREELFNDFEPAVFNEHPDLACIKRDLYLHGADFALLSGSGSAFFGLFKNREAAEEASAEFNTSQTFIC